jgi:hypothetical protein
LTAAFVLLVIASARLASAGQGADIRISGRVTDSDSGQPIRGVNVSAHGTTRGSATDADGRYAFLLPAGIPEFRITASMVGYESETQSMDARRVRVGPVNFSLHERTHELSPVEVTASRGDWTQRLDRFERLAFSTTENSDDCVIEHPEFLSISVDSVTGSLTASSDRPFVFDNRATGYRVTIINFRFEGNERSYRWEGSMRFEETEAESADERGREGNRLRTYRGSFRHFIASLTDGSSLQAGFRITSVGEPGTVVDFRIAPDPSKSITVAAEDPMIPTWSLSFVGVLAVTYIREPESMQYRQYQDEAGLRARDEFEQRTGRLNPRDAQYSWLILRRDHVVVDGSGNEYGRYGLARSGYWAWERMCEQLPLDWSPDDASR